MTRNTCLLLVVLVAAAFMSLVAASAGRAASSAAACPPLQGHKWHANFSSRSGTRYQWSVIGSWTCKAAKPWVLKLVQERPRPTSGYIPLSRGPKGYKCYATDLDKNGYAYLGECFSGTLRFPKSGFQWAGS